SGRCRSAGARGLPAQARPSHTKGSCPCVTEFASVPMASSSDPLTPCFTGASSEEIEIFVLLPLRSRLATGIDTVFLGICFVALQLGSFDPGVVVDKGPAKLLSEQGLPVE